VRRATCCPSKFYRQTPAPDFIKYPQTVDEKQGPSQHCLEPRWNMGTGIKSGKTFWVVDTCPNDTSCISPPFRNITESIPVTSLFTGETYINLGCASCNGEELSDLVLWEKKRICTKRSYLLLRENEEMPYISTFGYPEICNVGFYPPVSIQSVVKPCLAVTYNVECETRTTNKEKNYLVKACRQYFLP
jgi:hypothetical protein